MLVCSMFISNKHHRRIEQRRRQLQILYTFAKYSVHNCTLAATLKTTTCGCIQCNNNKSPAKPKHPMRYARALLCVWICARFRLYMSLSQLRLCDVPIRTSRKLFMCLKRSSLPLPSSAATSNVRNNQTNMPSAAKLSSI